MIYANNAGTSWPKPPAVAEAVAGTLAAGPEEAAARLERAHGAIARFLGVTVPERLLLTPGCTSALSIALDDLPWQAGDGIVTSSLEHHALDRPVRRLVATRGVVHHAAPRRPRQDGGPVDLDFVRDRLRGGSVRLVAMTAASNVTGELLPVEEIAALAREHGALTLIDAAQTVGVVDVDLRRLGADIVTLAGHKGPLGPHGAGGLWAAPGVTFASPLAACDLSGRSAGTGGAGERRGPDPCSPFPGYCDAGSVNLAAAAGLAAGMEWLAGHRKRWAGPDARGPGTEPGATPRALAETLAAGLAQRDGARLCGAANAPRTATVSFVLENLPVARAESFFEERGVILRAGQHCAPRALEAIGEPGGTIRASFGPFNEPSDVARILEIVDEARGTRNRA